MEQKWKQFLCAATAAVTAFCAAPAAAFSQSVHAASAAGIVRPANKPDPITEIDLPLEGFYKPGINERFTGRIPIPGTANIEHTNAANPIRVFDETYGNYMDPADRFQKNHKYRLEIELEATDNNEFDSPTVMIGGREAVILSQTNKTVTAALECGYAQNCISRISLLNVMKPYAGAQPAHNYRTQDPSAYRIEGSGWFRTDGTAVMSNVFEAGEKYILRVTYYAVSGSFFAPETDLFTTLLDSSAHIEESSAFAVTVAYTFTPAEGTAISVAELNGFPEPKAGEVPDYSALEFGDAAYESSDTADYYVRWRDEMNHTFLAEGDPFASGVTYTALVYLRADEGYFFTSTAQGCINGEYCDAAYEDDSTIILQRTFPATEGPETVMRVQIDGIIEPKDGWSPDYTNAQRTYDRYSIANVNSNGFDDGIRWMEADTGKLLTADSSFKEGTDYIADILLKPANGYTFPADVSNIECYVNGTGAQNVASPIEVTIGKKTYLGVSALLTASSAELQEISYFSVENVPQPIVGMNAVVPEDLVIYPQCHLADITGNGFRNGKAWYDEEAGAYLSESNIFKEGRRYSFCVALEADPGYTVDSQWQEIFGEMNGLSCIADRLEWMNEDQIVLIYPFIARDNPVIDTLNISFSEKIFAGDHPSFYAFPDDARCHMAKQLDEDFQCTGGVAWFDETDNTVMGKDDVFLEGHNYRALLYLEPEPGYWFTNSKGDVHTTVNYEEAACSGCMEYDDILVVYKDYSAGVSKKISRIDLVGVTTPFIDEHPTLEGIIPMGSGFRLADYNDSGYKNGLLWYDEDNDTPMTSDLRFELNGTYTFSAVFEAEEGYSFAYTDDLTVTVNGYTTEVKELINADGKQMLRIEYTYKVVFMPVIGSIELIVGEEPVCGAAPFYDSLGVKSSYYHVSGYASGTTVLHGMRWLDCTEDRLMEQDDLFEDGHEYELQIFLEPNNGYQFCDISSLTATVDGEPAEVTAFAQHPSFVVVRVPFTVSQKTINAFQLTDVHEPVAGAHPDFHTPALTANGCRIFDDVDNSYYTQGMLWYDTETEYIMKETDVFEEGKTYRVIILLLADEGKFFEDAAGTVNGKTADVGFYMDSENILAVMCDFKATGGRLKGDVDGNNDVAALDAQLALSAFLEETLGNENPLTAEQITAADVDGSGTLTAMDAQYILMYYLYNSVLDTETDWSDIIA